MLIFHFLIVGLIDQHAYTIFYSATSDFSLDTSFAKISNQNRWSGTARSFHLLRVSNARRAIGETI